MYLTAHQSPDYFPYMTSGFQMLPYHYMYPSSSQLHGLYVSAQAEQNADMAENGQAGDQSGRDLSKM